MRVEFGAFEQSVKCIGAGAELDNFIKQMLEDMFILLLIVEQFSVCGEISSFGCQFSLDSLYPDHHGGGRLTAGLGVQ